MNSNTEFKPYVNTIVKDLKKKGVNIVMDTNTDKEHTITLTTYIDVSIPVVFSKYFGPAVYRDMINALYDKLGTEHDYIITDDLDVITEYKREKKSLGDKIEYEVEYIRIAITFNFIDNK